MLTPPTSYYARAPVVVVWETARALGAAGELTTTEALGLVDDVAECESPALVLRDGDAPARPDLLEIIEYAVTRGLRTSVSANETSRPAPSSLQALARAGCASIWLHVDAPDVASFATIASAAEAGLRVQIRTTVSRRTHKGLDELAELLRGVEVSNWTLCFLVPSSAASAADVLSADETEGTFARLQAVAAGLPFAVKAADAPHYRRFVTQHPAPGSMPTYAPGVGDGNGLLFISSDGDVFPSALLPHRIGNVREQRLADLYRDDPFMQRLRDPGTFEGKCGVCEFNGICGGSRARALAMTGSAFASEPTCAYQPEAWRNR